MHTILNDKEKDRIVSYVMGLLEPTAATAFERHVDGGCAACADELHALNGVAGLLSLTAPLATPPARLRDRILKIPRASHVASHVMLSTDGEWRQVCAGVAMKQLDFDTASQTITCLCRMEPGGAIPPHRHSKPEQCFVVSGEVILEGKTFHAGDYVRESAGTDHATVYTATACMLLLVMSAADLMAV